MSVPILTIGYANRTASGLVELLAYENVGFLIDVRSYPSSKINPEFSRESLPAKLEQHGLRYVFMGDTLGGRPRDPSCYQNGYVIYSLIQSKASFRAGIGRLLNAADKGYRLCLMCTESRPEECHRSKLIGTSLAELGTDVVHLDRQGQRISQKEVMERLKSAQAGLFDISLQSRRAYKTGT